MADILQVYFTNLNQIHCKYHIHYYRPLLFIEIYLVIETTWLSIRMDLSFLAMSSLGVFFTSD